VLRLAAKRQAGSTSGALRKIAYKCRARALRRDPWPWHAPEMAAARGKVPALGRSDPHWWWGPGVVQPPTARFQPAPPTQQPPLVSCTPCLSFPLGLHPTAGMPGRTELPVGRGGNPGSSRPGREPHPPRWQPAWHRPVFTPPGCSPGAGCAGCTEPGEPLPSAAATPCASTPGTLCHSVPFTEDLVPTGTPWASLRGLGDRHDPSEAQNHSLRRSDARSLGLAGEGNA